MHVILSLIVLISHTILSSVCRHVSVVRHHVSDWTIFRFNRRYRVNTVSLDPNPPTPLRTRFCPAQYANHVILDDQEGVDTEQYFSDVDPNDEDQEDAEADNPTEALPEELVDEINFTTFTEVESHQEVVTGEEVNPIIIDTKVSVNTQAHVDNAGHNNEKGDKPSNVIDKNVSFDSQA